MAACVIGTSTVQLQEPYLIRDRGAIKAEACSVSCTNGAHD